MRCNALQPPVGCGCALIRPVAALHLTIVGPKPPCVKTYEVTVLLAQRHGPIPPLGLNLARFYVLLLARASAYAPPGGARLHL